MSETPPARRGWLPYAVITLLSAAVTALVTALILNMAERKREGRETHVKVVDVDESTVDPAVWGQNFPRQYDGYKATAENTNRRHGGSEAISRLEDDPRLVRIFAGYPFSVDFRERRGHAHMLEDQDKTERVRQFKQPGACLQCHASIVPAYREAGGGDLMKGFEKVCAMPLADARKLVQHPIACLDCHDPKSMALRVTRPGFITGIANLARSDDPVPHLATVEKWRKGDRKADYDPNTMATRQEMRSFVCGQCHVEYHFKPDTKVVTYPWHKGLKAEQIEDYYDGVKFSDYKHAETGAMVIKAQHPEFELWSQGIHARSGVSCADCHMPYKREGAIKVSDHQVRSPLLMTARACQTCHRFPEAEILARVEAIQGRTKKLMDRAEEALVQLYDTIKAAKDGPGVEEGRRLQRKAQWRVDFINAENSLGFHAPQEAARVLGEAIDYARQGQVAVLRGK